MATGIISNGLFFEGHRQWSDVLFAINSVAYPWLMLLTVLRFARFGQAAWSDLINPGVVFSFFTIVAGTNVFGVGLHLRGHATAALVLWLFALLVWIVLIYFSFAVLTFLNSARGADVIQGAWLNAIVGTQSLVVLGALVAPAMGDLGDSVFVLIHMLWAVGLGLYGIFIALFAYRLFFFDVGPDDITPLLWVVMGAAAISTNAGSILDRRRQRDAVPESNAAFRRRRDALDVGVGNMVDSAAAFLGIWKHGVRRVPLAYTPMLWSLVFPLGMYALASLRLSLAADFPPLGAISSAMVWAAVAAWAATSAGLVAASWKSFREFTQSDAR